MSVEEKYNAPNSNCCGRPMQYTTEPKCNYCDACMNEYCGCKLGRIKEIEPTCDSTAVIPSVTVESVEGITNLANCFVHVNDINTTFYVDDKHRLMITWAGPVNIPGYDMKNNPNGYRDQIVTDVENETAVIYDKHGKGYLFGITPDNLQTAINNKLDEMASDGTLENIVATYIADVAHVFDTVADMKASTELVNGSYARTLGFHTINDGGGATYYITDTGTANEMDVIAIGSLYANIIIPALVTPEIYGAYGDGVHDDAASIQRAIDINLNLTMNKNYLIGSTIHIYGSGRQLNAECSTITYHGNGYAIALDSIRKGGNVNFGEIVADNGGCITIVTDNGNNALVYTNISFRKLSPATRGINIDSSSTGFVTEINIKGGVITSGSYGIYILEDHDELRYHSNGNKFNNICFEGCDIGYYFDILHYYLYGYRFYNTRYVENTTSKILELHGEVRNFLFDSWGRFYESRIDLTNGTMKKTTLKGVVVDSNTQGEIAEGIYYDGTYKAYLNSGYKGGTLTKETGVTGDIIAIRQENTVTINFKAVQFDTATMTAVIADNMPYKLNRAIYGNINAGSNATRVTIESDGEIKVTNADTTKTYYGSLTFTTISPMSS